jgi:carbohydrate-binding DOMON domain-containing protein
MHTHTHALPHSLTHTQTHTHTHTYTHTRTHTHTREGLLRKVWASLLPERAYVRITPDWNLLGIHPHTHIHTYVRI